MYSLSCEGLKEAHNETYKHLQKRIELHRGTL